MKRRTFIVGSAGVGAACGLNQGVAGRAPEVANVEFPHPIHLSAVATLPAKAQGIGPNTTALRNPYPNLPMEIREITFDIRSSAVITGGAVGCSLSLGKIPLTNGYVPVWSFGKSRQTNRAIAFGTTSATLGTFHWALPQPLWVPPGAVIAPLFQHRGLVTADIVTRINLRGNILPKHSRPSTLYVPYVTSWTSKPLALDAADTDTSVETDISNPFTTPLFLQHMVGRATVDTNFNTSKSEIEDTSVAARLLQLRIIDSQGRPIVRNFSYFAQIFWKQTRAWSCVGTKMDPGDYYNIFLNKLVPPNGAAVTAATRYTIADVSVVGWREA